MAVRYTGTATTQRIFGLNQPNAQSHFTMVVENGFRSKRLVNLRRLVLQMDPTAVYTSVRPQIKLHRGTGSFDQRNASCLTKGTFDTAQSSDRAVQIFADPSWDANTSSIGLTAPTVTLNTPVWKKWAQRMHTAAGQNLAEDQSPLPVIAESFEFSLLPSEYVVVDVRNDTGIATANPNTNHWLFSVVWTEEDLVTYTVSGIVTLSAVPVVGAEVIVVIADDNILTNAHYWETVTTIAGGVWSSAIPVGKVAFAFAQDDQSGTLYTSEGRPYLKQ